jgi:Esterase-like activity of phytase
MTITITRLIWTDPHLADIELPRGTMTLTRSLASGLCQSPLDPPDTFWGVGDRGPNIKPRALLKKYGVEAVSNLVAIDGAKIMPLPTSGPAIGQFKIVGDTITLLGVFDLIDPSGQTIGGLPTPDGPHAETEPVYDLTGHLLTPNPNGADSEGMSALPDGSFWIAEEYGPSLLKCDRAGKVTLRWVPKGTGHCFAGAGYDVVEALPALASARKLNRGFEAIATSMDGSMIYVAFQSPLAHPDRAAHETSRHARVWALDAMDGALKAEYIYPLDDPDTFWRDASWGKVGRSDVKISEIVLTPNGDLLVLERISQSTKIYRVRLTPDKIAPVALSNPDTRPTLEQMTRKDVGRAQIPTLDKTLILSTDDHQEVSPDLEGMLLLGPSSLLLSNDSDFGVEGVETVFWRVDLGAEI